MTKTRFWNHPCIYEIDNNNSTYKFKEWPLVLMDISNCTLCDKLHKCIINFSNLIRDLLVIKPMINTKRFTKYLHYYVFSGENYFLDKNKIALKVTINLSIVLIDK